MDITIHHAQESDTDSDKGHEGGAHKKVRIAMDSVEGYHSVMEDVFERYTGNHDQAVDDLEAAVAELEGVSPQCVVATVSGLSAVTHSVITLVKSGARSSHGTHTPPPLWCVRTLSVVQATA
jgi:cystathionine beta-lyase/cystathionine gamma-synthase